LRKYQRKQEILRMLKKETLIDWLKVLVLLLDEAAVIAIIFLVLHFLAVQIPLSITIVITLVIAVLVLIVHVKVIPSFRWKKVTGRGGMVGLHGEVLQPLTPTGTVIVKGERWKAKSVDDVGVGEDVEVVGMEGLTLKVVRLRED
jgi:membrane-bound ClpP family serine protease